MKEKLLVFASGSKDGGGSGFEKLFEATKREKLDADIVAAVSNHAHGGVAERASRLGIQFIHFCGPYTAENYQKILEQFDDPWVSLSGWLKMITGHNPRKTFNIHPGPLPHTKGMHGHGVHEEVVRLYQGGEVTGSAVTMHFVPDDGVYDCTEAAFFQFPVPIYEPEETAETLGARVNAIEHEWQPFVTNEILQGRIAWDGENPDSIVTSVQNSL